MKTFKQLRGSGLPDVELVGGSNISSDEEGEVVNYADLDGLYVTMAKAVSMRTGAMTAAEFKFLRKRLQLTQQAVAKLVGKTDQAVIKWEKGSLSVPLAEANLMRLTWLAQNASARETRNAVKEMLMPDQAPRDSGYVFFYDPRTGWQDRPVVQVVGGAGFEPATSTV